MTNPGDRKTENVMSPAQAAGFLRRLADQLEQGELGLGDVLVETEGDIQIKQAVKTKADRIQFKLKLKYEKPLVTAPAEPPAHPAADQAPAEPANPADEATGAVAQTEDQPPETPADIGDRAQGRPKYKSLKKRMGKDFKAVKKALELGQSPGEDLARAFYDDCLSMCTYPGRGDEFYPQFLGTAREFLDAALAGDLAACQQAVGRLDTAKKECHDRHK